MRADRGLAALLAAAGLYQIAGWARAGLQRIRRRPTATPVPAGAGEIRLETQDAAWVLIADLRVDAGANCWLLLQGASEQVASATGTDAGKLRFGVQPGPAGTYRFWIVASKRRHETPRSLAKKAAGAIAAGEFNF